MSVESDFFDRYVEALERRTATLFVGAGLSAAANFPDWKTLLSGVAEEIELDVKQETDLPAVAQFYLNRFANSRGRIADLVSRTFRRSVSIPDNHRILARLPYRHVWTTNYDHLLERAWELSGKRLDIKSRNANLTTTDPEADAILYKMHGTADHPDEIVLCRDDYELYPTRRPGFLQILGSELITNTFLFLGLSFTDPNLSYLMGTLRASFQNVPRQHFTIMKRSAGQYAGKRFRLFTDDLQRYGIRTLIVDEYADITKLLKELEQRYAQKNVFVAGSYPEEDGDAEERGFIARVARGVGRLVARRGLNLVSGFGRVVGSQLVSSAFNELYQTPRARLAERIMIRPTRDLMLEGMTLEQSKRRYREDTISQSGIVIVIAGLRKGTPSSPGVMEEFEIATLQKKPVLPIAATGHAAKQIYERILDKPEEYLPPGLPAALFRRLGPEVRSVEDIEAALDACITAICGRR
jgi:hypothetical protein